MHSTFKWILFLLTLTDVLLSTAPLHGDEPLFVAKPLTTEKLFTPGIEGPACDKAGKLYVVNFEKQGTIGAVKASGEASLFASLPGTSVGNGIRFDREGNMYIADYVNHNVLKIAKGATEVTTFAHEAMMNQPNDLAITSAGVLYASDPNWGNGTGQIWRVDRNGKVKRVAADMGTTNGVEVSPDEKTLYVNESVQRNVWAFRIDDQGNLSEKRLVKQFPDFGFDGMRCDVDGNLYITRHGKGTVVKLTPSGEILKEIDVLGDKPTNICFGGTDGRTAYVTEVAHQRVVQFRVDKPGREWKLWQ